MVFRKLFALGRLSANNICVSDYLYVEPKILYGLQRRGPSSFNSVQDSGAEFGKKLWLEFIDKLVALDISLNGNMFGISWPADEAVPPQEIHYFCGLELSEPITELEAFRLEGGNYFEYFCDVPADDIDLAFQEAYTKAMPASGFSARDGQHIEIYGEEYDPNSDRALFRILIPVE